MTKCVICNGSGEIVKYETKKIDENSFTQVTKTFVCHCKDKIIYYPTDEQATIELLKSENAILKQHIAALEEKP